MIYLLHSNFSMGKLTSSSTAHVEYLKLCSFKGSGGTSDITVTRECGGCNLN